MDTRTSRLAAMGVAAAATMVMMVTVLSGGTTAHAAPSAAASDEACLMRATTGQVRCYPSADALLEAVTGEPADGFTTADLAAPATVAAIESGLAGPGETAGLRGAGVPFASVVTAVFYDGLNGTGAALVMEAPSGCDDDLGVEWAWPTLTPEWRNRIRSGIGYARCDFKVWNHAWYAGAAYGYVSSSGYFGALDGAANSVRMR